MNMFYKIRFFQIVLRRHREFLDLLIKKHLINKKFNVSHSLSVDKELLLE